MVRSSSFRRSTMACTGIEFCKLALAETKMRAQWLYKELEERLPDFDEDIRINVNGCPNSCARFQVADIGLMGAVMSRADGSKVDGFLVYLGGRIGEGATFGRKAKGVRVYGVTGRRLFETWYRLGGLFRAGLDLGPIVTHRLPLEQFEQGFELIHSGQCGKVVLVP